VVVAGVCYQNCWVSRHDAAGRLKVEAPTAVASAAAADNDRPAASMMHRIASSPAITDRYGRHQSRVSPAFLTTDELWKPGGRGAQHVRLTKTPADENLMLAPPGRAAWQGGSIAGRRTPSVESNKQTRYFLYQQFVALQLFDAHILWSFILVFSV